ncbi:MAG: universal stress protein [Anaerolineae bacterium]|nr:universal stress protein [Anaerolineae bacterium]
MFEHILVPLDRSTLAECVLPHIAAFAKAFASHVTLLHVLNDASGAQGAPIVDPVDWHIAEAQSASYLEDVAGWLGEVGIDAEHVVLHGAAAERVIEYAAQHDVDLIVLSSHGMSGLSGWNVSSIVQKIILRAYRSILIVRAYVPAAPRADRVSYRRLLVPLDGSQRAECVVPIAAALGRSHDGALLLAHVVRRPEMPRRTSPTEEDIALADRLVARNQEEASAYLEELKRQLPVEADARVLVSEDVAVALHELVDSQQADLVVLSAHGYSGAPRWSYGSVATSLIAYGSTPLLIVQDLLPDDVQPSRAELAAKEHRGH